MIPDDAKTGGAEPTDTPASTSPVEDAMEDAIEQTVSGVYALVGVAVGVAWWQLVGGLSVWIAAFGCVTMIFGLPGLATYLGSRRWPTTRGEITGTEVESHSSGESGSTSYSPKLRYEYEVDGETYVSGRYRFGGGPGFSSRSKAEAWLEDSFPVGTEVTVHYSPDRPDLTVLEPGGLRPLFLVLFGLVWIGLGTYAVLRPATLARLPLPF